MAKKGPKMAVFWPSRAEICENQKKAWTFSYFYPREAVYQISENLRLIRLGENALRTNGRTNGRTDGTEIIGPSGKIPGTKKRRVESPLQNDENSPLSVFKLSSK